MKRLLLIFLLLASPLWAVQPDEVLDDPALEARARQISAGLRCPVCQNESIDDSNAGVSRDLRLLVRERLVAGDSDAQTVDYIVARYGEYVLLLPTGRGGNLLLWAAGPLLLLLGGLIVWRTLRGKAAGGAALSAEEQAELERILRD